MNEKQENAEDFGSSDGYPPIAHGLLAELVFVGSWGTTGGFAACDGCGGESRHGVNFTIRNEEVNLCGTCGVKVKAKLIDCLRERQQFDDIRQGGKRPAITERRNRSTLINTTNAASC